MRKFIFHETRVQGTWLSNSENRCSISRTEKVLLIDEKKTKRKKTGVFFKSVRKVTKILLDLLVAVGYIAGLITFIGNLFF